MTPGTTLGFEAIEFAQTECGLDLLPWQQWCPKAMLELREDGTFRYRRVIVVVGRQNGKTTLLKILALFLMQRTPGRTVLGVAQDLSIAKESWGGVVELCEDLPNLTTLLAAKNAVRKSTGHLQLSLANKSRYRIAAANGRSGRGLSRSPRPLRCRSVTAGASRGSPSRRARTAMRFMPHPAHCIWRALFRSR